MCDVIDFQKYVENKKKAPLYVHVFDVCYSVEEDEETGFSDLSLHVKGIPNADTAHLIGVALSNVVDLMNYNIITQLELEDEDKATED